MSLRGFLARLVWLCVLPMIVIAGYLAYSHVKDTQAEREVHAANRARNVANAVDSRITFHINAMNMLAASPHAADPSQLPEFYEEAQRFRESFGAHLVLADLSMQMLLNTSAPLGTALPKLPQPDGHAAAPTALATGKPAVGDIFLGPIVKVPLVAVVVPVIRQSSVKALLLSAIEIAHFGDHLNKATLPPGWSLTLLDGNNGIIAIRGALPSVNNLPVDSVRYVARTANAPWSVELKVPAAEHKAALVSSVGGVMTAILAAIVLSVFGGQLAGRRLERAMAGLALPEIEARESADLNIKEISAVRARLDAANAALRAGEARYRELFESNPQPMWVFDLQTLKFLAVNDAAISHFGYSKPEFLALTIKDIRSAEDVTRLTANVAQLISGFTKAGIHRLRRKDGTLIEADISWHTLLFDGRNAAVALVQDVTEIKRALFAVQEQEGKFRALTEQSLVGIVIVEEDRITYANQRVDEIFGYTDGEAMGRRVAEFVVESDLPRIETKLRQLLANKASDLKDEFRGRRKDGTEIVIGAHGKRTHISGKQAVIGVIQDITEKQRAEETIREYIMRLERAITSTVDAVSLMVELRDPYTAGHEHRVGEIAAAIADEMGLDINVQRGLRIAGALHDVGKVAVPAEILSKPSRLTAIEYELVKSHAQQGYEVLRGIDFPWPIAEVARQHHERMDGSGYPRGLIGDAILIEARITAVADVVESMAAHRPYRPGLGLGKALEEIERGKGALYDPEVAAACLRLFRDRGYQIPV